jgi:hydrogenase maturation protease
MCNIVVIGVGNIIFKDDGIGVFASKALIQNYNFDPPLKIVDGGTLGIGLIEYIEEYDHVLILDTISIDDEAGSIYRVPSSELLGMGRYKNTAHEVEVVEMLQICQLHEIEADVVLYGIVPSDISSVEIGLSEILRDRFLDFLGVVLEDIRGLGVIVTESEDGVGLDSIIKNFVE